MQWPYLSTLTISQMPILYVVMCKNTNSLPSVTVLFPWNRTANGVPDTVHRPYPGVLYSQNATQFYGTHVSINHLQGNVWPFLLRLSRNSQQSIQLCTEILNHTKFYSNWAIHEDIIDWNSFMTLSMGFSKPIFTKCETHTTWPLWTFPILTVCKSDQKSRKQRNIFIYTLQ